MSRTSRGTPLSDELLDQLADDDQGVYRRPRSCAAVVGHVMISTLDVSGLVGGASVTIAYARGADESARGTSAGIGSTSGGRPTEA